MPGMYLCTINVIRNSLFLESSAGTTTTSPLELASLGADERLGAAVWHAGGDAEMSVSLTRLAWS